MDMVIITKGSLTTTSKIIADYFGKSHRDVTKAINSLECSDEFSTRNFSQSEYKTGRGKSYKCYEITEKGFYFLAMGFSGSVAAEWKEKFLDEFDRLRGCSINADQRINEISAELKGIKDDGSAWSKMGMEIKNRKRLAITKSNMLLEDVQMRLDY